MSTETVDSQVPLWRRAASMTSQTWTERYGALEDCETARALPDFGPTNRQFWLGGMPFCNPADPPTAEDAGYRVEGIAYSEHQPVVVRLAPTNDSIEMETDVVDEWNLPELASRFPEAGETKQGRPPKKITYERDELEDSPPTGKVIQVVVVPNPEKVDYLGRVRLLVYSDTWPDIVELLRNPPSEAEAPSNGRGEKRKANP